MKGRARFVLFGLTAVALIGVAVWQLNAVPTDPETIVRGSLGPTPGPSSEGHVKAKRAYLDRLARSDPGEESAALVSLAKYLSAPSAQSLATGTKPTAVFVRFPASEGEVLLVETTISGAVADRAAQVREEIQAEVDALTEQAAKASGASKTDLDSLVAERKDALAKVKSDCACVYAFAVTDGSITELHEMQQGAEVKLVDVPDPVSNDLRGWELTPIVPKV
ncbi:MAG: hypothetical protein WD826_03625 [Actinomycetota bacterium]